MSKSPKKGKIHESTPKSYVLRLKSYVPLEPPCHTEIIEEWQLINDVIGRSVDIKHVFIVINIGHGEIEFKSVTGAEEEFLLGAKVKAVVAWQARLVKLS